MSTPLYGPDMFFSDITVPDPATVLNEPMPRAWATGGMIESLKTAVITGLREQFQANSLNAPDAEWYISIEYPTKPTQYPGIWVQFAISKIQRAGIGMGTWTKDDKGNWGEIQEWMFEGSFTLTVAAETAKDRDRLTDTVMANLAFARSADLALRDPRKDAKEKRGLIAAIDANPYVAMTLNTDQFNPGGPTVTQGTPWAENVLLYEDNYSMSCLGQFNMRFSYDGVYQLARIDLNPTVLADHSLYNPVQWGGPPPAP